jgi:anti-anti-sigma regulatory factor
MSRTSLTTYESWDGTIVISARDRLTTRRAEELWHAIESELQHSAGRQVVVDLTRVRRFDSVAVIDIATAAHDAERRRDNLCILVRPRSRLGRRLLSHDENARRTQDTSLSTDGDRP